MTDRQFNTMVEEYGRLVYTVCYRFVQDHQIAEDLAQETFLAAYRNVASCPPDAEKPWLMRIATNKAKDHLKSAYNRRVSTPGDEGMSAESDSLFMHSEKPEDLVAQGETMQQLKTLICSLKEPYHSVATLYFLEDLPVEAIASRLERPPKTIHTQLYRARGQLQQKLKGEDGHAVV